MEGSLQKCYNPQEIESKWCDLWENETLFVVDENKSNAADTYSIVIPPPNVTGRLHLGHALDNTIQDILIRYKRMCGFDVLWVPGTDHAAIATEAKIMAQMREKGITKEEIGREGFLRLAFEWKQKYGGQIISQLKRLGCSCDWSKERFTMDKGCTTAVIHFFIDLYSRGLIYQGERIVNWCPRCKTPISDAEVEHRPQNGKLWYVNYEVLGGGNITVATTRPETMLGDTAIAVNPNDERYCELIGKIAVLPIIGRKLPIVADASIEMAFGTGAVKITPAHDSDDFELGQRHNLEIINVITEDGKINESGEKYAELPIKEAREKLVFDLEEQGFIVKVEEIEHNVGICYRCSEVIEPLISKQWFVKMRELAAPAIKAVKNQNVKFVPERFSKTYFHWMENVKDWCISRQLWWGHRIPAYHCESCGKINVSATKPTSCDACHGPVIQDENTLDTWFSAALWPFSVMGWPEKTVLLEKFFPTKVLVTGYDIIFFWVARMIFSSLDQLKIAPFEYVYIHGLVRDEQGRKMSKSLGNGVDPLQVIEQNGADVLRMALIIGTSPGNDMRFSEGKILLARNFANKLWNAARFVLMNLKDESMSELDFKDLKSDDKWIVGKLELAAREVTSNIENFEFGIALQKIYDFTWDVFCDWYIEFSKTRLKSSDKNVIQVLVYVLKKILKLLHPFMPFVTEEIWRALTHSEDSLVLSKWHTDKDNLLFESDVCELEKLIGVIKAIRNARAVNKIPQNQKLEVYVITNESVIKENSEHIKTLAGVRELCFGDEEPEDAVSLIAASTDSARIFILVCNAIDKNQELLRLRKALENANCESQELMDRLRNSKFLEKAPKDVVVKYQKQCEILAEQVINIQKNIEKYG